MAINFPLSPSVNQTYTYGSRTWNWNGSAWVAISSTIGYAGSIGSVGYTGSSGAGSYTNSDTAPTSPSIGDRWFNTNFGVELVWNFDGDSYQWVEISASGYQGQLGYTGSVGPIGYTGSASTAAGYTGSRAYTGSQGYTGSGYTGSTGYAGSVGFVGSAGYNGSSGYTGSVGFVGSQGTIGYAGSQGYKGGYPYIFSTQITSGTTSNGELRYNNGTIGSVTAIYMNTNNSLGTNLGGFIATWGNSTTQTTAGFITIEDASNTVSIANIFSITGLVTASGTTYTIPVSYVNGGSIPSANENISINFYRTGNIGFTGSNGAYAAVGFTGSVGSPGGFTGSKGDTGFTGSVGFVGSQAYTGSQGYAGSVGFVGSNSTVIGYTGSQGYWGSFGYTGSFGNTGYTGSFGYTGSVGYAGSASTVIGYTGSIGLNTSIIALSDEFSDISTGYLGSRSSFWAPYNMTLSQAPKLTLTNPGTSTTTVDMLVNGSSILSTKLTLTSGYSGSAATPAILSTTSISNGSFVQFILTSAGSGASGLKVTVYY
jgi:Collagen triple helix repeat (20 copies)